MKKVLVMPWILALILFCSTIKIKALSLDGTINRVVELQNEPYCYMSFNSNSSNQCDMNFAAYFTAGANDNYAVFTLQGAWSNNWEIDDQASIDQNVIYNFQFVQFVLKSNNQAWQTCEIQGNLLVCPITQGGKYTGIRVNYNDSFTYSSELHLKVGWNVNLYSTSTQEITNTIEQQTQQQQQQYEQATNGTWTPSNNINTEQNGANETIEWGQQEEALMDQLDMNTTMLSDININPTAAAFIWDIVGGLRNMNPAIVMLFTSLLGLGIARMILNR